MPRIEVTAPDLLEMARHLAAIPQRGERVRDAVAAAGPAVTGSAELSAALREHAEVWSGAIDDLHERLQTAARTLKAASSTYARIEHAVATASVGSH